MQNSHRTLQGDETLHGTNGAILDATVLEFWRWAFGDLCQNNVRGVFAEWLVANLLGIDLPGTRDPWAAHDLELRDGLTIEIKCCACLQAWHAEGQAPSAIGWSVPQTQTWTARDGYSGTAPHNADLYVLCVQIEEDPARWDALDFDQWRFHVLTRERLASMGAARISRRCVTQVAPQLTAGELQAEVARIAGQCGRSMGEGA